MNKIYFALFILILLTGCAERVKLVEVPTPIPCEKPKLIPYHDYMSDLNENSSRSEFLKACLATRVSLTTALKTCERYHRD